MYYLLLYDVVENYVERRKPLRGAHLERAKEALARGELVLGGAFADPVDGAALVFKGDDPAVAEQFARNDPYVVNGLVASWRVRAWNVVVGGESR
jgi:uncharacterized protein